MIAQDATVGTRLTREALAYSAGEKDSKFHGLKFYDAVFHNSVVTMAWRFPESPIALEFAMATNGNSFEQPIICLWVALDCITDRELVVARSAEAASDAFISKSLETMLITVVAFIIRTISHHIFSSFRETTFQKIGGLPAPVP
jgi:hypothetical protein